MTDQGAQAAMPGPMFHEAPAVLAAWRLPTLVAVVGGFPLVALPVKWALNPQDWPPDTLLVVLWLAGLGLLAWGVVIPLLATWQRVCKGETAGLRIADGGSFLEVAFFIGRRPCRIERFAYADITGCGADHFQVTALGEYELRPFVATRGVIRATVRTPLRLGVRQDTRRVPAAAAHAITADMDRIIRRHCPLPEPDAPLAAVADAEQAALLRSLAERLKTR